MNSWDENEICCFLCTLMDRNHDSKKQYNPAVSYYVSCESHRCLVHSKMQRWDNKSMKHNSLHCDPMDYRVHGILQARILQWVAILFSRGYSQPRDWTQVSIWVLEPRKRECLPIPIFWPYQRKERQKYLGQKWGHDFKSLCDITSDQEHHLKPLS